MTERIKDYHHGMRSEVELNSLCPSNKYTIIACTSTLLVLTFESEGCNATDTVARLAIAIDEFCPPASATIVSRAKTVRDNYERSFCQ